MTSKFPPAILVACVPAYLLLQLSCGALAGDRAQAVAYGFSIGAPLLASAACIVRARRVPVTRTPWSLTAVAMLLWALGMSLSAWQDLTAQVAATTTYFSDFVYFVYGVPLLLAILSATGNRAGPGLPWLDAIQVTLAAYLAYVAIFSVSPLAPHGDDAMPIALLVQTYDTENLLLACCATVRLAAHRRDGAVGRYYGVITAHLWLYALCAVVYNHQLFAHTGATGVIDCLPVLPFLVLAVAALHPRLHPLSDPPQAAAREQEGLALVIDNFTPIIFTGALLGLALMVIQTHRRAALVSAFVALGVYALRTALLQSRYMRAERELRTARDRLEKLALQDGLTGIANRRCFDQTLAAEWERGARAGAPLALLMVDIDHFKSLNDHYGPPYGDACLARIAAALHGVLPRSGDVAARYGGEEFVAILPATDRTGALLVAEKMRAAVAALGIGNAPARGGSVTVSVGVATVVAQPDQAPASLITVADQCLYRAKQNGRNRVEADPGPVSAAAHGVVAAVAM